MPERLPHDPKRANRAAVNPAPADDTYLSLRIKDAIAGLRDYGYRVTVKSRAGYEQEYYETLRNGLRRIETTVDIYRAHFRVRGTNTKRIRNMLWRDVPEPCWGVHAPMEK